MLGGDPSDEAAWEKTVSRFWLAVQHLQNLHIIYRVLVLWHGNPLDPKQRRNAEPIATQYIHDRWAREIDPHLQYEANKAAWRMEARDVGTDLGGRTRGEEIPFIGSGSYRYIVKATAAEQTFLVGQFRVRYWPSNQTTVTGRAVEKQRTLKFMKAIKNLL